MSRFLINLPARFCEEKNAFETLDVIVDIGGGKVDLRSKDKSSVITFDLPGVEALEESLRGIVGSRDFQGALRENVFEHSGRNET